MDCVEEFAEKVRMAVKIAEVDPHRATTHNKGIYNGVDAVVLPPGNDFRAVEACGHTYAARNGSYSSLTHCTVNEGIFKFWIDLPLAVGTVGGLTQIHPLVKQFTNFRKPECQAINDILCSCRISSKLCSIACLNYSGHTARTHENALIKYLKLFGSNRRKKKTTHWNILKIK
ncbi:MAG: hypothetical protein R2807_08125 [Chitinophagales bacterium]